MSVTSITMLSEINAFDGIDPYDDPPQGATYGLTRIYRIVNDDGDDQYFKLEIELDSYGNAGGNYSNTADSIPRSFTEVVPEETTITRFV